MIKSENSRLSRSSLSIVVLQLKVPKGGKSSGKAKEMMCWVTGPQLHDKPFDARTGSQNAGDAKASKDILKQARPLFHTHPNCSRGPRRGLIQHSAHPTLKMCHQIQISMLSRYIIYTTLRWVRAEGCPSYLLRINYGKLSITDAQRAEYISRWSRVTDRSLGHQARNSREIFLSA